MRRLALFAVTVAITVLALGSSVAAEPNASLNRQVTGPFSGTESFLLDSGCSFVHQGFDATYQPDMGRPGSFHIDVCVEFSGTSVFPVNGAFQLTTPTGATLTGDVAGAISVSAADARVADLSFTLTVREGTRQFSRATGTIALDGSWPFGTLPGNDISGTLAGSLEL